MNRLEKSWYQRFGWSMILLPLTLIFWFISALRRKAYHSGILKSHKVNAKVIVVGNISVGGNGKTPLVIYLSQLLKQQGYRPGVLSRGYGGSTKAHPMIVNRDSDAVLCGDEPLFIRQRVNCPVVVDPDRVRGANKLITDLNCNVILCDDGLQHYRLSRDVEIAVVDGERRQGNGMLLPAGPLREGSWRLSTVDFVVLNGGQLKNGEHQMSLESGRLVNVKFTGQTQSLSQVNQPVTAIAGIGNPARFFSLLTGKGIKLKNAVEFADHHQFKAADMPDGMVLMTEKDAVKCKSIAHDHCWYLPVSAKLTAQFDQLLLSRLKNVR